MDLLTKVIVVGIGLSGGVLLGFSAFVMPALDSLPAGRAVEAMQAINRFAVTPAFMTLLFGTAALCVALVVATLVRGPEGGGWLIAGAALYLVGVIGLTAGRNVPLNDALATVDAATADAARWAAFSNPWTTANHLRTAAAALAAAVLLVP